MITRKKYESALKIVLEYQKQVKEQFDLIEKEKIIPEFMATGDTYINCYPMSTRLRNALRATGLFDISYRNIESGSKLKDLESVSMDSLMKFRNFGKSSMIELACICHKVGIKMKP